MPVGETARVVALQSVDPARLERLAAYGLTPGSLVRVAQHTPTLIFQVGETEVAVDTQVAGEIMVTAEAFAQPQAQY
jgi:DtxR family Mn-dependent transcriptional regulator